jgi:hypothetical protein
MKVLALLLAIAMATLQTVEARLKPSTSSDAFTRDQEIQIGQQTAAEAAKKLPLLPDSDPITKYVQQLGAKLVLYAPGEKWPYSFHVINQKEINAFALPIKQGNQTLQERDWLVTTQRADGSVIYLVFIAPEKDFPKLHSTFEQMLRSFKGK